MMTCERCHNWAQWRMYTILIVPARQEMATIYGEDNLPVEKALVPRGPELIPGPVLCTVHKQEEEKKGTSNARFVFAGALPN